MNTYAFASIVLLIMTIIISGLEIQPVSSVTTDLTGASNMSTNSNSSQTGNTTMNIPSNETILNETILNSNIANDSRSLNSNIANDSRSLNSNIANDSRSLNSNITNKSSSLNTTLPEQLPPESINGSKVAKI